jgi:hypothetical protein
MNAPFARYTGSRASPFPARGYGPGTCKSCGCDSGDCRCGCRVCRKEAKELTLVADAAQSGQGKETINLHGLGAAYLAHAAAAPGGTVGGLQFVTAFVGGGCCVHIALEYAPITATTQSVVAIIAKDPDGTLMLWEKTDPPGAQYQVKECVVTTKPGATIALLAVNASVRARWCEVFSC